MNPQVKITTSLGEITLELDSDNAPKTTQNFLNYVDKDFYNGTIFHRVIDGFMIQGGGFEAGMIEKNTSEPIKNENPNTLKNDKYTIAMARTQDPHSATAQFFINVADNTFLDFKEATIEGYGYCVFGKVINGQDTVDKIRETETQKVGYDSDVPINDITITSMEQISK